MNEPNSMTPAFALRNAADQLEGRTTADIVLTPNQLRALALRAERMTNEQDQLRQALRAAISIFQDIDEAQTPGTTAWLWLNRVEALLNEDKP
ncbi:MAG: hypothetical protein AAF629_05395 [Chloroflexota bacterium]